MPVPTAVPALGADGWFTTPPSGDGEQPALVGQRCTTCGTYVFPPTAAWCPSPACVGTDLERVELSRTGTVWSYTDARYQPPPPYVPPTAEHELFALAAVELAAEGLVVMGQVTAGVGVADLSVGTEVEVAVEPLYSDDKHTYLTIRGHRAVQEGRGRTTAERRRHHPRRAAAGEPERRPGLLRRGGAGPGAGPSV